jgi:ADP-heptose:LPS heptosyltransferase
MNVLVHLASGIGNIVLATPLLVALDELGLTVDVCLSADYPATADLLRGWSILRNVVSTLAPPLSDGRYDAILPAVPPFYWSRFRHAYHRKSRCIARPADSLFYENEQAYYLAFARALGYPADRHPPLSLPVGPSHSLSAAAVVLAPGSKTGEMSAKRWPWFSRLAASLPDVSVVGTADDLFEADGSPLCFPPHVQNLSGKLSLRETAETIAAAGLVIANDTGLAYVSAAVGTPTIILFGPTPDRSLGPLPANVTVVRCGLPCEPCWFTARLAHCSQRLDCLRALEPDRVLSAIQLMQGIPQCE